MADEDTKTAEEANEEETLWVVSNRKDDRIVIWERDPHHPGGEAFIGGPTPEHVAHTAAIDRLLHEGLIVEVPEPPGSTDPEADDFNRKKPLELPNVSAEAVPAQPGQPIPLGREMDPDLVPAKAMAKVRKQQEQAGKEVPAPKGAVTPPEPGGQKTRRVS